MDLVGSEHEAKNYVYTLEYIGKDGKFATFDGQVIPIDKNYKSFYYYKNFDSSIGFQTDFDEVKEQLIVTQEDKWIRNSFKFTLVIRNLKEAAKDENFESGISDDDSVENEAIDEEEEQLCQELSPIDEPNDDDPVVEI